MVEEKIIDKLRRGEKVLCPICEKAYMDNTHENRAYSNYFHCENENCTGYVHEQKVINID